MPTVIHRRLAAAVGAGVLVLGVAACGSSSGDDAAPAGRRQQSSEGGPGQDSQGLQSGQGFPGASGEVVAVSGSTAQVQSRQNGQATGQTAVTWNGRTTFTQQVDAALADVTVGSCVTVGSASTSESGQDTVAADTVRIVSASGEDCSPVRGGSGGRSDTMPSPPEGGPSGRPSGAPTGMPSGGGIRVFGGAFGKVTAVDDSGFTVESSMPGAPGSDGDDDEETTSTVTVTVSGDTTYTKQAAAKAAAVKVGVCVQARGESDDTGAVTATSVQISAKVDGACAMGLGPGGMRAPDVQGGVQGGAQGQES